MRVYKMDPSAVKMMRVSAMIQAVIIALVLVASGCGVYVFTSLAQMQPWFNVTVIIVSVCYVGYTWFSIMIKPRLRYKYFEYTIAQDVITIRYGIFTLKKEVVPRFRIQNVNVYESLLMRYFGLAQLQCFTAANRHTIGFISFESAESIKHQIKMNETEKEEEMEA